MTAKQKLGKLAQARGQSFEIKEHNKIKKNSIISARSSGSKGFADILAVLKKPVLLLTLCKTNGYLEPKERRQIDNILKTLPKNLVPKLELRYYKSKRKVGKMLIDDNWEERYNRLKPYQEMR